MAFIKLLQDLGVNLGDVALVFIVVCTLIQIAPIKIDPWSSILKWLGRAMNGEVIERVKEIERRLDKKEKRDDERDALSARRRIIVFNDEIVRMISHTPEHWNSILEDTTDYEKFCDANPGFKNDRASQSIINIRTTYSELQKEHKLI